MFSESADLYDLIYSSFKDYSTEARQVAEIIRREHPSARTLLDVACGTGEHARLLMEQFGFDVEGLDLDPTFVRIASDKLGTRVYEADMTSFSVGRRYDVIVCLFSSIGYVRTLENVARTLACFRTHLAPGGVVLVEPWFPPGVLDPQRISLNTAERDGIRVARMSQVGVEGRLSRIHFEYLVGRNAAIEHFVEVHELGLFTREELLSVFAEAGYTTSFDETGPCGRGLYVARVAA